MSDDEKTDPFVLIGFFYAVFTIRHGNVAALFSPIK